MKQRTYDILNAGPRNRFMASGVIVSNSSRGTNLQNLSRGGNIKTLLTAVDDILNGADVDTIKMLHGAPLIVASEMLRPTFVAPKTHWMARGDYSQIEARMLAWMAGEETVLQAFRDYDTILGLDDKGKPIRKGPDIYRISGSGICGVPPLELTDQQRQLGKVGVLALGYAGGVGAFHNMAKIYGVKVSDEEALKIRDAWRETNPNIVRLWHKTGNAAMNCMKGGPGTKEVIRPGMWFTRGKRVLVLRMPSGRSLTYWYPKIEKQKFSWGVQDSITCYSENAVNKQFTKNNYYSGIFVQNACQALARDVMAYALVNLEEDALNPLLSVHDEALCQVPKEMYPLANDAANAVTKSMMRQDSWCFGLPVAVDSSASDRYVKA